MNNKKSQIKSMFVFLIIIALLSITVFAINFSFYTDKTNYSIGDTVNLIVAPADVNKSFFIVTPVGSVNTDSTTHFMTYEGV